MSSDYEQMEQLYEHLWDAHFGGDYAFLDQSLGPRSPSMMYDIAQQVGIAAGDLIFDAGCGRGNHACNLVQKFGCRVAALDASRTNIVAARYLAAKIGCGGRIMAEVE